MNTNVFLARILESLRLKSRKKKSINSRFVVPYDDSKPTAEVHDTESRNTYMFHAPTKFDHWTVSGVFTSQDYIWRNINRATGVQAAYERIVDQGRPLIIDAGANIGASSTLFSIQYPKARVVCLEPDPRNAGLHRRNCRSEQIVLLEKALGRNSMKMNMTFAANPRGSAIAANGEAEIEAISMQDLLAAHCDAVPFLLKVDIEGHEKEVFRDCTDWVDKFPVIVVEPHDWKYPGERCIQPFLQAVECLDRDLLVAGECLVSLCNRRTHSEA